MHRVSSKPNYELSNWILIENLFNNYYLIKITLLLKVNSRRDFFMARTRLIVTEIYGDFNELFASSMDRIRRMFISVLLTGLIVVSRGQILIRSRGWRAIFPVNGRKSGKIGSLLFGYRPWWHKHRFRRFLCTHARYVYSIDTVSGKYRWFWYTKSRVSERAFIGVQWAWKVFVDE